MKDAVETYLRLRRSTGFALSNDEYLLASLSASPASGTKRISVRRPRSTGPLKGRQRRSEMPD